MSLRVEGDNGAHANLGSIILTKIAEEKEACISKWRMEGWTGNCAHQLLSKECDQDLMKRDAHYRQPTVLSVERYSYVNIRCKELHSVEQQKENDLSESQRFYIGPHDTDERVCQTAGWGASLAVRWGYLDHHKFLDKWQLLWQEGGWLKRRTSLPSAGYNFICNLEFLVSLRR